MDRPLDDVVRERQRNRSGRQRRSTPQGGVRKPSSRNGGGYDESRLWVHDKFDDTANDGSKRSNRNIAAGAARASHPAPSQGTKIKVENIHYELGEDDLLSLFRKKGAVTKLELLYDRAGRSEGTCFVTYARESDASAAIRDYDGANAKGQPISLTLVSPSQSRSLFDRIKSPESDGSPPPSRDDRRDPTRKPTPPGIDRYVPLERRRERGDRPERSERTQSGPRPAIGRERGSGRDRGGRRRGGNGERGGGNPSGSGGSVRPRKTVEELDAEMNDYFGNQEENAPAPAAAAAVPALDDDADMIL